MDVTDAMESLLTGLPIPVLKPRDWFHDHGPLDSELTVFKPKVSVFGRVGGTRGQQ